MFPFLFPSEVKSQLTNLRGVAVGARGRTSSPERVITLMTRKFRWCRSYLGGFLSKIDWHGCAFPVAPRGASCSPRPESSEGRQCPPDRVTGRALACPVLPQSLLLDLSRLDASANALDRSVFAAPFLTRPSRKPGIAHPAVRFAIDAADALRICGDRPGT